MVPPQARSPHSMEEEGEPHASPGFHRVRREGWQRGPRRTWKADQAPFKLRPLPVWSQEALSFHFHICKTGACVSYLLLRNKLHQNLVT